jgi:hypothetical protein
MRFSSLAVAAASLGVSSARVIQARHSDETCSNLVATGEVLHTSLHIVEFPVIVDVLLEEDTVVTIDNTILIECTNAPTHLHTTVYATTTETITKTISTATISADGGAAPTVADSTIFGQDGDRTVTTKIGTKIAGSNPNS